MRNKILLIDDDEAIRETVKEVLESAHYVVECAGDGLEAIGILQSTMEMPSLIILDLKMPKMDGYEFREYQEKKPQISKIPVLLMTADAQLDKRKINLSPANILKKPVDLHDFLEVVKKLCPWQEAK